jgi:hypothetical protein
MVEIWKQPRLVGHPLDKDQEKLINSMALFAMLRQIAAPSNVRKSSSPRVIAVGVA